MTLDKIRKGGEASGPTATPCDSQESSPVLSEGGIESPSDELARLIKEQEYDDRPFQQTQPFTVHFGGVGADHNLDIFGQMDMSKVEDRGLKTSDCPIHGFKYMVIRPSGRVDCAECNRLYQIERRRARGIKPLPKCPHGEKTKTACAVCRKMMLEKSRAKFLATPKGQAYQRRKWARASAKRTPEQRHAEYLRLIDTIGRDELNARRRESYARARERKANAESD